MLNTNIVDAAKQLDFARVNYYATQGEDINATFSTETAQNVTPLHHLIANIDSFLVKYEDPTTIKITNGKAVSEHTLNFPKETINPALFEEVQKMIELGAKVDAKLATGETPLLLAAQQYPLQQQVQCNLDKKQFLLKLITLLVEKDADENIADNSQFKQGVMTTAKQLAGLDPAVKVEKPRTMLFSAIKAGIDKRHLARAMIVAANDDAKTTNSMSKKLA